MIIEQIPNVQVKIQTSDGSVFVYTMDQVLKITKEPK
jgi:nitrogen regulatory protein PII